MDEFALIRRHFAGLSAPRADVALGIGDDAALLCPPAGEALAMTSDTLIEGRHFPPGTAPADIAHKALAVNLSDLAAMGARPLWFTLALSLPAVEADWLAAFAAALRTQADAAGIALVGGDTTRGPLALTITAVGGVPLGAALRRDGARPGDTVLVSGTLGDAALALEHWQRGEPADDEPRRALRARLDRPTPRLALGLALRGIASAAIDLSDGLAGDLGHVLAASGVGAAIDAAALPRSAAFAALAPAARASALQLQGGDDYELCFCVPPSQLDAALALAARVGVPIACIGHIRAEPGLELVHADGAREPLLPHGYRHFR